MSALYWLNRDDPADAFPPADSALREPNGLLAAGGDLSVSRLRAAYSRGLFPWFNAGEPVLWWCPDPRCVFETSAWQPAKRFARSLRNEPYAVTLDTAFDRVIAACAAPREGQRGTWLVPEMRLAYRRLHQLGWAHSVEVWHERELIGGLYGVAIGRMFYGESMFSVRRDASKIALHWLCQQLSAWNFPLLDAQVSSPHLLRLGAVLLARAEFLKRIAGLVREPERPGPWRFEIAVPHRSGHLAEMH